MKKNNYNINFQENTINKGLYSSQSNITNIADFQLASSLKVQEVSFINMVFDSKYRNEVYAEFDEIYVETDEEREIFELMRRRR